jgi:multisubunit Na+/H+ antiporter MnhG subunit
MSLVLDILSIIVICAGAFFFFAGTLLASLKLIAIWVLVQLAGATATQLIARAARRKGPAA